MDSSGLRLLAAGLCIAFGLYIGRVYGRPVLAQHRESAALEQAEADRRNTLYAEQMRLCAQECGDPQGRIAMIRDLEKVNHSDPGLSVDQYGICHCGPRYLR